MKLVITGASGQLARPSSGARARTSRPEDLILTTRTPAALAAFAARGVPCATPISRRHNRCALPSRAASGCCSSARRISAHRIEQQRAALDAAKAVGVRHVIYTSGLKPEPPNPAVVAPSHYATEQALTQSGLDWTILRNSLYADYQAPEAAQAIASGALVHNRGAGKVAYVAREDCAAVAAAVLVAAGMPGPATTSRVRRRTRPPSSRRCTASSAGGP